MIPPRKPTCFDCLNANVYPGFAGTYMEPPEAPEAECKEEIPEELYELTEEAMAEKCGKFNPRLITKCGNCGKGMNVPEYSWELWGKGGWVDVPVCSEPCRVQKQSQLDAEIEEMIKGQGG